MTTTDYEALTAAATAARELAYAPYSKFKVGAALLTESGEVHTGCNVENASFGLTVCAERVAVLKAVSSGDREFKAIALSTKTGAAPCGACRQFLSEFRGDIPVIIQNLHDNSVRIVSLETLLPDQFELHE